MIAVALTLALTLACSRPAPEANNQEPTAPPMEKAEQDRGLDLCIHYVARVCACAEHEAALKEQCELGRSQPQALRLQLSLLHGSAGKLNDKERRVTEAAVRKVVAACVKADAALSPATCPRQ